MEASVKVIIFQSDGDFDRTPLQVMQTSLSLTTLKVSFRITLASIFDKRIPLFEMVIPHQCQANDGAQLTVHPPQLTAVTVPVVLKRTLA